MNDGFDRYFAEKLWEMIPSTYRHEDGLAEPPGVLRGIVETIAAQAAVLRRSQDRLWEDQFVELCNDWAVPYLADLVGTRLVSALNPRGRRVDVAKTIYYRRRKGTPRVLEELISDISGWDGRMVEQFQHLARTRHGLDAQPLRLAGRFSGTMPGGLADLRRPVASEVSGTAFDEYFHTPDFRQHRTGGGRDGLYNIHKLAFHLYRLKAYAVQDARPFRRNADRYTFDPSGRDIPLFNARNRAAATYNWDDWRPAREWELPAPMRCRLLGHAEYRITDAVIKKLLDTPSAALTAVAEAALRTITGAHFRTETRLREVLASFGAPASTDLRTDATFTQILRFALLRDCGKQALLPDDPDTIGPGPLVPDSGSLAVARPGLRYNAERTTSGNLQNWTTTAAPQKHLVVDPEHGRFLLPGVPLTARFRMQVSYHYGFPGDLGAGTYGRGHINAHEPGMLVTNEALSFPPPIPAGLAPIVRIENSFTYRNIVAPAFFADLTLEAENQQRPYLLLEEDWLFDTGANTEATLVLDGLWVGSRGDKHCAIVLRGDFERVVVRHCTLDPGGSSNALGQMLNPLPLRIEGNVETLVIERSVTGPIWVEGAGVVETVCVSDSIVQRFWPKAGAFTGPPERAALKIPMGMTCIERSTVFGPATVYRLSASESLFTQLVDVTDTQAGCFRFSAAPRRLAGVESRLPRPYESFLFAEDSDYWFASQRFGHPAYGQLTQTAPAEVVRGAQNGSEMGAWNMLANPVKFDGLRAKVEEYMPFGLIPMYIFET